MSEREYGPQASLTKRRLWGAGAIVVVLAFVIGIVLLFDTTVVQDGEPSPGYFSTGDAPPSPWIFVLASAIIVVIAVTAHRLGGNKEDDD